MFESQGRTVVTEPDVSWEAGTKLAMLSAIVLACAATVALSFERVVLPADYRLRNGLGAVGAAAALAPLGLGLPVALPLGALSAFLGSRTDVVRFAFDEDAIEILDEKGGTRPENFAVGGQNRWRYEDIFEWAMYPSPEMPILVYFAETATSGEGQGHLFPVLTDPVQLRVLLDERVGAAKRIEGLPDGGRLQRTARRTPQ